MRQVIGVLQEVALVLVFVVALEITHVAEKLWLHRHTLSVERERER